MSRTAAQPTLASLAYGEDEDFLDLMRDEVPEKRFTLEVEMSPTKEAPTESNLIRVVDNPFQLAQNENTAFFL
ncbi:hypothetical protein ADEAN_000213400 [Angomonas deanei]|uniref:Uncharacterized protein n=1 Tax=Angomonas deanei TaxID=59799 RepID=A0A7G2C7F5_9TRYP|nr:hypothetical protein ADEAN_000213400 [Angomonas deanei]